MIIGSSHYASKLLKYWYSQRDSWRCGFRLEQPRDNTFTLYKVLGQPKLELDENISELLHTKILDANKKAKQLNTPILRQFLSENGYELSK
jgi:hypothetical protein